MPNETPAAVAIVWHPAPWRNYPEREVGTVGDLAVATIIKVLDDGWDVTALVEPLPASLEEKTLNFQCSAQEAKALAQEILDGFVTYLATGRAPE